jgi:hypothetical protein
VLAVVVPLLMLVVAAVLAWAAVKLLRRGQANGLRVDP